MKKKEPKDLLLECLTDIEKDLIAVSYTHLDVYKRQAEPKIHRPAFEIKRK